jgi:malonate-semialdehyde dehydrogenase (acetylating) / methylmalonate-semialdehyde dehydrogenase
LVVSPFIDSTAFVTFSGGGRNLESTSMCCQSRSSGFVFRLSHGPDMNRYSPLATTDGDASVPHFFAGKVQLPSVVGAALKIHSPLDGAFLGELHSATTDEIEKVVAGAREAFASWRTTPIKDRVQVFYKFKQLVEEDMRRLSETVSRENGKTIAEAEAGIRKGLEVVEFATSLPNLIAGNLLAVSSGVDCHTRRFPLGVVAGITPFNFPAMVPMWMFPLAIACGNTFILKPSEQVPFTPVLLAELLTEAGLPPGVFNVVQGTRPTVEALLDHQDIQAVTFVGSTKVAREVYSRGIASGKRVLALGGAKNHVVVVPDADPEITARNVVSSAMGCAGQRCMAASVMVAVGAVNPIIEAIVASARSIRTGIDMGAVINPAARDRIMGYIDRAEKRGAKILIDGRGVSVDGKKSGNYVGPTIIDDVKIGDECACDEIFGPVLTILRVRTLSEALEIVNATPYGNAASIYTSDGATAAYFEEQADAGMIGVNIGVPVPREPFSFGGWKNSRFGHGDITGMDAVNFWTQSKKVTRKWSAHHQGNWMS